MQETVLARNYDITGHFSMPRHMFNHDVRLHHVRRVVWSEVLTLLKHRLTLVSGDATYYSHVPGAIVDVCYVV